VQSGWRYVTWAGLQGRSLGCRLFVIFAHCAVAKRQINTSISNTKALRWARRAGAIFVGWSSASSGSNKAGSGEATGGTESSIYTGVGSGLGEDDRTADEFGDSTHSNGGNGASGDCGESVGGVGTNGVDCDDEADAGASAGE